MRKLFAVLLALLMLAPAWAATAEGLEAYACEAQGYATLVDPAWNTEWVDGDGTYFHFDPEDNMPYILLWVNSSDGRVVDGAAFLDEELPRLEEKYAQNGAIAVARHGEFTVGGRPVAAADLQYHNSQGLKIHFLFVVDARDDFTAFYRVRYLEEDQRQAMLDGLDVVASNLHLTGEAAPGPAPEPRKPADSGVYSVAIRDLTENECAFGRCVAPAGAEVTWRHSILSQGESFSTPCRVMALVDDRAGIIMGYFSNMDYLSGADGDASKDGQYNEAYCTPMLHYMTASEYCDYFAGHYDRENRIRELNPVETNDFPELQPMLDGLANAELMKRQAQESFGLINADWTAYSMCCKRYAFTYEGNDHYMVVMTGSQAIQFTSDGYARISWISWQTPFTYVMTCPADRWEEARALFSAFVGNTTVSDQFLAANQRMADALWQKRTGTLDLTSARDYCERELRSGTSSGDDYDEDRVSDYLFDQNDYTLSTGEHVKVSTAYDYVYEGDNGTVYYSDSAFPEPGARLTPNH